MSPPNPADSSPPPRHGPGALALWANLAVIYVVWGSTYLGIAVAIETFPPFLMAAIRFTVAGAALIATDVLRHPNARRWPTRRQLADSAIVGGLLLGVGNGCVCLAQESVPSGIAALLIAMTPLWFALTAWVFLRQRPRPIVLGAIALGFLGTALLVWPAGRTADRLDPAGILLLFVAELGWALGSVYSASRAKLPPSPLTASGLQMLAGAALTFALAIATREPDRFDPAAITMPSVLAVAYLVLFGSMLAYTSYGWLLRHAPLPLVSTYAYVNPIVAVTLGTAFLHEPFGVRTLVASAIILLAVAIIVSARNRTLRAKSLTAGRALS